MVAYPNPSPIIVNKPFYLPRDFLYPIHGVIVLSAFHHQPMCRRISLPSYRMTIKASPSTHTSRKPSSSTKETIFKHARTSAMVGSRMFSHRLAECGRFIHDKVHKRESTLNRKIHAWIGSMFGSHTFMYMEG
ncbi:uncharacterized protein LOC108478646 isoform X1 [Gossypium arboreum]|uniref:uncharacterized protein LOC108478646 isoform X1 n=1 Tax=Gossypium arboreum TaxID=29729 RepID=UPI000818F3AB|nr:uncharacterized protein LOC108478646 isoform X1 [Gossypium arboreum]